MLSPIQVQVKTAPVLITRFAFAVFALVLTVPAVVVHAQNPSDGAQLHSAMPLGGDSIVLQPSKHRLNMLATVECKDFDNIRITGLGQDKKVQYLDGNPVKQYPQELSIRFTIGSRTAVQEPMASPVDTALDDDHFQSNLRFRLKVFRGIDASVMEPVESKMIGVPADVPSDERIYHVTFNLPAVPVEDRIMFEVLDETGTRVAKFHLQLK